MSYRDINAAVFPQPDPHGERGSLGGLSKRELFAAMAMQAILTADRDASFTSTAFDAARYADALIAELTKVPK